MARKEQREMIVKCPNAMCNEKLYYGQISAEYASKIEIKATCSRCGMDVTRTIRVDNDKT